MRSESLALPIPHRLRRWPAPPGWLMYLPVILLVWLGSGRGVPGVLEPLTPRIQGLVTIFLGIIFEALPFVVGGVLLSSAIALYVDDAVIRRIIPRGRISSALVGSLLGLLFPVCECGTVPATRRLLQKGAPLPFGIAFLLAAPVINPIVIASTYIAFSGDWLIVGSRVGLTLMIAFVVALVLSRLPRERLLVVSPTIHAGTSACGCEDHSHTRSVQGILRHGAAELIDMSRWLFLGALLAATLQTFVSQSTLLGIGSGPVLSVVVLMALAVLLSVCSTVDAFLALALSSTFGPGALVAFLVFGPMIDIKSTLMFLTTLSVRAVGLIIALVVPLVIVAGVVINLAGG
jgi:uncharacterized protein